MVAHARRLPLWLLVRLGGVLRFWGREPRLANKKTRLRSQDLARPLAFGWGVARLWIVRPPDDVYFSELDAVIEGPVSCDPLLESRLPRQAKRCVCPERTCHPRVAHVNKRLAG